MKLPRKLKKKLKKRCWAIKPKHVRVNQWWVLRSNETHYWEQLITEIRIAKS